MANTITAKMMRSTIQNGLIPPPACVRPIYHAAPAPASIQSRRACGGVRCPATGRATEDRSQVLEEQHAKPQALRDSAVHLDDGPLVGAGLRRTSKRS